MPTPTYEPTTEPDAVKAGKDRAAYWLKELDAALKREKSWRKDALRVVGIYEAAVKTKNQYNILYANTETLAPALYNSTPRPVVERRFKDEDPLGKMASKATQRMLEYMLDNGEPQESPFSDLLQSAVLEALVPGRGLTRFRYDAQFEEQNLPKADNDEPASDTPLEPAPEKVKSECVYGEEVPWDRFRHGYAKKWKDVPWVSFEHDFDKGELEEHFPHCAARISLSSASDSSDSDNDDSQADGTREEQSNIALAKVFEIWDRRTHKVYFVSPNYADDILKEVADPFGLTGFFPCPEPLRFMPKISSLVPVPLYTLYEEQAKELNSITVRINALIAMCKVRGMYDSTIEGIDKVLSAEDGALVPAQNVAALIAQGNALEKGIWLMPIDKVITVLQQLYAARPQIKSVIFEISGIADIMRGSSAASETLGAQKIKETWGSLRLKRSQKKVAQYARDCLRIMAELGVSKFAPETMKAMTGLPYPTGGEKAQLQAMLQQAVQIGQEPPPQALAAINQPSWDDILGLLRNDIQRSFRIDIETNSTVDAEATEDKENIAELLNAMSQFLNGVAPLVEGGQMPFEVAQGMLLAIIRRFRFGPELEDQLKQMKPPPPKQDPAVAKAQADLAMMQQQHQLDMQAKQMDLQAKQQDLALKERQMQLDMEIAAAEHSYKMQEMQRKAELTMVQHTAKLGQMRQQAKAPAKPAGITTR